MVPTQLYAEGASVLTTSVRLVQEVLLFPAMKPQDNSATPAPSTSTATTATAAQ